MDSRVRLQTITVAQTVDGMIEKFYSLSEGEYEFDAVGVSSLLYELEQCVKRHPKLQELLTAVHGDLTPYNVFAEAEEVLFEDPTGVVRLLASSCALWGLTMCSLRMCCTRGPQEPLRSLTTAKVEWGLELVRCTTLLL